MPSTNCLFRPRKEFEGLPTIASKLSTLPNTTIFSTLVQRHPDVLQALENRSASYTLFAPTDAAFHGATLAASTAAAARPHSNDDDDDDDDDDNVEGQILRYHIVPHAVPALLIPCIPTVPTLLTPASLGNHPQRLALSLTFDPFASALVNSHARITTHDIRATNGVIHVTDALLAPPLPAPVPRVVLERLDPARYAKYRAAVKLIGGADRVLEEEEEEAAAEATAARPCRRRRRRCGGAFASTWLAPTDAAFDALGPVANAFLFSPRGRCHLRALLRFHVLPGVALYSNALYGGSGRGAGAVGGVDGEVEEDDDYDELLGAEGVRDCRIGTRRFVMDTLLLEGGAGGRRRVVDFARVPGAISMVFDGEARVGAERDLLAEDGVVHGVDRIVLPRDYGELCSDGVDFHDGMVRP